MEYLRGGSDSTWHGYTTILKTSRILFDIGLIHGMITVSGEMKMNTLNFEQWIKYQEQLNGKFTEIEISVAHAAWIAAMQYATTLLQEKTCDTK